ncbi:MAG: hypothetical protein LVS60_12625 [Nodosilinea sp. LVE1205-7]
MRIQTSDEFKPQTSTTLFGATAGTVALGSLSSQSGNPLGLDAAEAATGGQLTFNPVKLPMPLTSAGIGIDRQATEYASFKLVDDLVLPRATPTTSSLPGEIR